MTGSFINSLFNDEPAGTFLEGHIFTSQPDLAAAQLDPANGYWHCDIEHREMLTWSEKVYELFGRPTGSPLDRDGIVAQYAEASKEALERVRKYALSRGFGFILDAAIEPGGNGERWIRVLAVPVLDDGRVVGLHGMKRAL